MHAMSDRISQPALRRLQLRMRPVLRQAGGNYPSRQGQGGCDAGGDCEIREKPAAFRDRWLAERRHLGATLLSESELQHGINAGILNPALLNCEVI